MAAREQDGRWKLKDPCSSVRRKARFIVEVRYPAAPRIFDSRGRIIEAIHPKIIGDGFEHWQIDTGTVVFRNSAPPATQEFTVSLKRSAVVLEDPGTVQSFFDRSKKYLGLMYEHLGPEVKKLTRIGVRFIQISSPAGGTTFEDARARIADRMLQFPDDLTIQLSDIMTLVEHEHGRIQIGPVRKGETSLQKLFNDQERNVPDAGILLDLDAYETDLEVSNKNDLLRAFTSVFKVTSAVEASLLRHIGWIGD